ncbi:MAG: cyclic nucleotide-binding domain-containing protein [Deltaproteobacteria bacterium]|nr:cyclic nucleotide-binding domain-containing protein [Deltaproteobacteria bacterium]
MELDAAIIGAVPMLAEMNPAEQTAFMSAVREERVGANAPIVGEGEVGTSLYLIIEGAVAVTKAVGEGRVELLNVLTQGDYFGEMALLTGSARSASVVALEPVRLLVVEAAAFARFLAEQPAAGARLFRRFAVTMSERLRDCTEKLRGVAERGLALKEDVQRMQSEATALITKELRTPVTVLKGTTDLLAEVAMPVERRRRFLQTMTTQVEHLSRLLTDINQLVELEYRPAPITRKPTQLQGLLQLVLEDLAPAIERRGIRFTVQIPGNLPPIPMAPEKIGKVLFHLLDNGVKYNRERGELTFAARRLEGAPEMVEIAVRDTGAGLAKAVAERLTGDGATAVPTRQLPGGGGVGILLARKLVELHGGKLWFAGVPEGGTTFYFTLPI